MNINRNSYLILISFSCAFAWIMAFPYEGPVLSVLAQKFQVNWVSLNNISVFFHFLGLVSGGYITKSISLAKRNMFICIGISLVVSLFVPFIDVQTWFYIIPLVSFLMGITITSSAPLIKEYIKPEARTKLAADFLIYGNILLVIAHILANNTKPIISFIFIAILLIVALIAILKIKLDKESVILEPSIKSTFKEYSILLLFIFILTINSGIMFQIIYPYFSEHSLLVSIYTNIPYIIAVLLLSRLFKKNKFYFLYIGLALWAITFILFGNLDGSAISFLLICSVMLFACGVFDFFWWNIMINNLSKQTSLLALGLGANVLGVWVGGVIGNYLSYIDVGKSSFSYIAFFVIILSMLILFPLNNKLANILETNDFLVKIQYIEKEEHENLLDQVENILSNRELEVFQLLIEGKTNTQISQELFLSPHTVKTHNRNIYKKLNVSNKIELIKKIS